MVTNEDGHITQNVVYIPYGEVFVEERNGSWTSPYLFNAKELDEETGLYYYGARYLDPAGAKWLSVDPMWNNDPDKTPYNYCLNNPVKMVDPDGRKWVREKESGIVSWKISCESADATPSNFEYIGDTYKGLSVNLYNQYEEEGYAGLFIELCYNGENSNSDKLQWIQSIETNQSISNNKQYIDRSSPTSDNPFYYTENENTDHINNSSDCVYKFEDRPSRYRFHSHTYWEGELSLVEKKRIEYTPKITVKYGFKIEAGHAKLSDIIVTEQSQFQKNQLYEYNNKH